MTARPLNRKYPPGLKTGIVVKANAGYSAVYRRAPRDRQGRVVAPTSKPDYVRVLWDGLAYDHEVNCRLFDVAGATP